jgi:hypothetical protein
MVVAVGRKLPVATLVKSGSAVTLAVSFPLVVAQSVKATLLAEPQEPMPLEVVPPVRLNTLFSDSISVEILAEVTEPK